MGGQEEAPAPLMRTPPPLAAATPGVAGGGSLLPRTAQAVLYGARTPSTPALSLSLACAAAADTPGGFSLAHDHHRPPPPPFHLTPSPRHSAAQGYRMSPKKLNVVAQLVRGLSVREALAQLALLPKRGARVAEGVLKAASANAVHNHGLDGGRLRVAKAFVGKGQFLKRVRFHARGKTGVVHRPKARW